MRSVQVYIEGQRLELFNDESIKINLSIQNIADISKQYADFTQTFSVPASPTNNAIFEHFYLNEVDATFDYNLKRNAYIEIDYSPFRSGKIQLNKATLKGTQAYSYAITFYGKLTNLMDIIKDFKLKDLPFNEYTHLYNGDEVLDRITDDVTNYDIRYPLITGSRYWSYDDGTTTDIKTTSGAVLYTELFPAISIDKVFTLIETQYDIDFQGTWRIDKRWKDCYLLLKKGKDFQYFTKAIDLLYNNIVVTAFDNLTVALFPINDTVIESKNRKLKDYYRTLDPYYNTTTQSFVSYFEWLYLQPDDTMSHRITMAISNADTTTKFYILVYENNILTNTFTHIGNGNIEVYYRESDTSFDTKKKINFKIKSNQADPSFNTEILSRYDFVRTESGEVLQGNLQATQPSQALNDDTFDVDNFIPDMTIKDFLAGVMKQFNLVFDPLLDEDNNAELVMRVEPLDTWYQRGGVIDITDYVDVSDIEIEATKLYKSISFEYQKSESLLNTEYRDTFNAEYGDLKYLFPYEGEEFKIQLPFENLLQTTFTGTDLQVGLLINKDFQGYDNKPILLYKYDLQACDFKFDKGASVVSVSNYIPFGQDLEYNGNDLTLHFNSENSTLLLEPILRTSFFNYYQGYLENLFDNKQRMVKVKAELPISLIQNLRLNDRLIINDKRFYINNIELELTSGKCNLELIYDFR
jgi:hypothetical protein